MNMKDNLMLSLFKGSLYKKLVVWKDLGIQLDEYQSPSVVNQVHLINKYQEEEGYIPTKLKFEEITLETVGFFSFNDHHA